MTAYYNEFDPFATAWLRELIKAGHIAPGIVDERSIIDVHPDDLKEFTQCHFFAGIGVWSYALRRAGWPDNRPVWTGSCPCQPFSAAGKGVGFDDERHLWPAWYHLITQHRPVVVFGEQVASKAGLGWLDLIQTDLEGAGYASGAVDLCAAGVGAPHIRQRLFFVAERMADTRGQSGEWHPRSFSGKEAQERGERLEDGHQLIRSSDDGDIGRMADGSGEGLQRGASEASDGGDATRIESERFRDTGRTADTESQRCREARTGGGRSAQRIGDSGESGRPGPTNGLWRDADWLGCRDGKWRPVEPGTFPLAHGTPARVGRSRGYGNAINAEVATAFISAYLNS